MKVGVLGGIGPQASANFYILVIKKLQESGKIKSNTDFPQMIINSIPAKELITSKIDKKDLDFYFLGLKELDKHNPDFIVMVCNTIHLYYESLDKSIKSNLINIREEMKKKLLELNAKKVTILATPSTISSGLYMYDEFEYENPDLSEQKRLSECVFRFNNASLNDKDKQFMQTIAKKYKNSDVIILGCTEFALMFKGKDFSKIDSVDLMADVVVERILKEKIGNYV